MSVLSLISSVTTQIQHRLPLALGINNVTYLVLANRLAFSKYRALILSYEFYGVRSLRKSFGNCVLCRRTMANRTEASEQLSKYSEAKEVCRTFYDLLERCQLRLLARIGGLMRALTL